MAELSPPQPREDNFFARVIWTTTTDKKSLFGPWCGVGRHPCADVIESRLLPQLRGLLGTKTLQDVRQALRVEFARIQTTKAGQTAGQGDCHHCLFVRLAPLTDSYFFAAGACGLPRYRNRSESADSSSVLRFPRNIS